MALPQLPGIVTPPEPPAEKAHKWDGAEWGSTDKVCSVCGVTELLGLTRADMEDPSGMVTGKKVRMYHYRDAQNKTMSSLIPLACPAFVGDIAGTLGETKQRLRTVTGRVGSVEGRVESVEDRVARLEEENVNLRQQVNSDRADVIALVNWLGQMVREHSQRGLPSVEMTVEGERYQLPPPVANVIRTLGSVSRNVVDVEAEYVTVPVRKDEG